MDLSKNLRTGVAVDADHEHRTHFAWWYYSNDYYRYSFKLTTLLLKSRALGSLKAFITYMIGILQEKDYTAENSANYEAAPLFGGKSGRNHTQPTLSCGTSIVFVFITFSNPCVQVPEISKWRAIFEKLMESIKSIIMRNEYDVCNDHYLLPLYASFQR